MHYINKHIRMFTGWASFVALILVGCATKNEIHHIALPDADVDLVLTENGFFVTKNAKRIAHFQIRKDADYIEIHGKAGPVVLISLREGEDFPVSLSRVVKEFEDCYLINYDDVGKLQNKTKIEWALDED